jgi:transcriptional regulator with XRE-family HTH domain
MGRHVALASRIRELRLSIGYTQQDLSQASGLSRSYISRLEMGDIALPSRDKLRALAAALGTSLDDLLHAAGFLDAPTEDEGLPEIRTYLKHKYAIYDPNALQAINTLVQLLSRRDGNNSVHSQSTRIRAEEQPDQEGIESTQVD